MRHLGTGDEVRDRSLTPDRVDPRNFGAPHLRSRAGGNLERGVSWDARVLAKKDTPHALGHALFTVVVRSRAE
jgi:hypothetical protein